jgi:hypothetical protein
MSAAAIFPVSSTTNIESVNVAPLRAPAIVTKSAADPVIVG